MEDIHNYDRRIARVLEAIKNSPELTPDTKTLLLGFDRCMMLVERLSKARRAKQVGTMFLLARNYFHGDLRSVTADDIKDCVKDAQTRKQSPWTAANYKGAIKKFYKWLAYGDQITQTKEEPAIVKWITVHVRKKDRRQIQASDILTEDEAHRLIAAADKPRDRAFISMLYELGARIGEIGTLSVGDVSRDQYSFIVDLSGKTGHRTPRIVMSDPYLTEWLNCHPFKDDPAAPMWVCGYKSGRSGKQMHYAALRGLVLRLKERAGIKKRIYPHLFRHSRVTHLLSTGLINEAQAKIYFGWTPDSKMLSDYSHLVSRDADTAILAINGIRVERAQQKAQTKPCPRCQRANALDARFCVQCSASLDPAAAFKQDQERKKTNDLLNLVMTDAQVQRAILSKLSTIETDHLADLY